MTAAQAAPRRGSRVSPRRRRLQASRHATTGQRPITRPGADDQTPYWIFVRDPDRGLMLSDGLNYLGKRLADREAVKLARHYGQPTEVRPSPRT